MNAVTIELVEDGDKFTVWAIASSGQYSFRAFAEKYSDEMPKEWSSMMRRLKYLANYGSSHDKTKFRKVLSGIYEAKTRNGLRALFFYTNNSCVICASGFHKTTDKTPGEQKKFAQRNRKVFESALNAGLIKCVIPFDRPEPRRSPI